MLRALLMLTLLLTPTLALAAPVEAEMTCLDAADDTARRVDRIVVVTGFSTLDAIVVVTGFKPVTTAVACVLTLPPVGVLPAMRVPVVCHPGADGRLRCGP